MRSPTAHATENDDFPAWNSPSLIMQPFFTGHHFFFRWEVDKQRKQRALDLATCLRQFKLFIRKTPHLANKCLSLQTLKFSLWTLSCLTFCPPHLGVTSLLCRPVLGIPSVWTCLVRVVTGGAGVPFRFDNGFLCLVPLPNLTVRQLGLP